MSSIVVKRYIFDYGELLKILTETPYSKRLLISDFDNNQTFEITYDSTNNKYVLEMFESTVLFDSVTKLIDYIKKNFVFIFLYAKIYYICDFDCDDKKIKQLYEYLLKDKDNLLVKITKVKQMDYSYV